MAMGFKAFGKGGGHHPGGGGGHHHHGHGGGGGWWGGGPYYGGDSYVVVEQPTCPPGYAWDGYRNVCVQLPAGLRGLGSAPVMLVKTGDLTAGPLTFNSTNMTNLAILAAAVAAGGAGGAFLWKKHRILGGVLGAAIGAGTVWGVNAVRSSMADAAAAQQAAPPPTTGA
jgi:hypothetical protein